ncbi:hypothetical protein ACJRO7_015805, partial [Eucalyptus globulus]
RSDDVQAEATGDGRGRSRGEVRTGVTSVGAGYCTTEQTRRADSQTLAMGLGCRLRWALSGWRSGVEGCCGSSRLQRSDREVGMARQRRAEALRLR